MHEHIKDLCRRLAHSGYYAIAPSLYARYGDPGKYDMAHIQDLLKDIVAKVPDSEVMSDLDSAVDVRQRRGRATRAVSASPASAGAAASCGSMRRTIML